MRKTNPNTHQDCRSLLQKAVRRGDVSLMLKVVYHLQEIKDTRWLKMRTSVITFEECWPLGAEFPILLNFEGIISILTHVTIATKNKDAAGLGSLAYAQSLDDPSVLKYIDNNTDIKNVSDAIRHPSRFWDWAIDNCSQDNQRRLIESAKKAHRQGGWPWDKAFMQAASYLAVIHGIPDVTNGPISTDNFLFWVALDKHTGKGKKALYEAALKLGISKRELSWISFYCESVLSNEASYSYWWMKEIEWRLGQLGIDNDKAFLIWGKAQPIVAKILENDALVLENHINKTSVGLSYCDEADNHENLALLEQSILPGFA